MALQNRSMLATYLAIEFYGKVPIPKAPELGNWQKGESIKLPVTQCQCDLPAKSIIITPHCRALRFESILARIRIRIWSILCTE